MQLCNQKRLSQVDCSNRLSPLLLLIISSQHLQPLCGKITERYGTQLLLLGRRRWLGLFLNLDHLDHLDHLGHLDCLAVYLDSLKPHHHLTNKLYWKMGHPDLIDIHMDNLKSLHQLTNNLHHNVDNLHQVTSIRNNVDNLSLGGKETGGVSQITILYIFSRTKRAN